MSTDERAADCFRTFRQGGVCGQVVKNPKQNIREDPGVSWDASVVVVGRDSMWDERVGTLLMSGNEQRKLKAFENTYLKKSKNSSRYDGADGDLHAYDEQQNL